MFFNLENGFTELVDSKLAKLISKSCDRIEENYAKCYGQKLEKAISVLTSSDKKPTAKSEDLNFLSILRIQGIAEDPENLVPNFKKVKNILQSFNVNTEVSFIKRLGKFDKTRAKPRILLVTVRNENDKKLIMAKSVENRENLTNGSIYLLPASRKAVFKESSAEKEKRTSRGRCSS